MPAHAGIDLKDALRYIALAAEACAFMRLVLISVRRFRWWLALIGLDLVGSLLGITLPTSSVAYREMWLIRQPLVIVAYALASWEVLSLLCEGYPQFDRKRRQLASAAAAIAAPVAALIVWNDIAATQWLMPWLQGFFAARRTEAIATAVWLIILNVVFAVAPAPARRNSSWHARIFGVYVVADAIGYFAMSILRSSPVQVWLMLAQVGCFTAWIVAIQRDGDVLVARAEPDPEASAEFEESDRELDNVLNRLE